MIRLNFMKVDLISRSFSILVGIMRFLHVKKHIEPIHQ